VIANSRFFYDALRWAGVLYLLWLAWEAWAAEREVSPAAFANHALSPGIAFRRGLVTNLLNPKAAVFYVAVLPEFIRISQGSVMSQTLLLSAIYVAIATFIHVVIVVLANHLQSTIKTPETRRTMRRVLAVLLAGIAIWFAVSTNRS
jgi:threonine/homoserine/homoserine lactone efflux protein